MDASLAIGMAQKVYGIVWSANLRPRLTGQTNAFAMQLPIFTWLRRICEMYKSPTIVSIRAIPIGIVLVHLQACIYQS